MSHSPGSTAPARLFSVVTPTGHGCGLIAVNGHDVVIAATRPLAAWALRRTLSDVAAYVAVAGLQLADGAEPEVERREPVPA